ncbi:MAG: acyl-[acyl-carrier-protein]--UDP-N-acetylglucosamine O-acyltransferase [Deltaproteobacteria bacterium]|nr:MAG: acyl-[acyl-carrier-protein]--UDP-N-acetylglucosamine O-acyltransferase [Deltaproteobacteria bacterium]
MAKIHPSAIVSDQATLADDVCIGPYAIIEGEVDLGAGSMVEHHATVKGKTVIGENCRIYPYALVGTDPQDLKHKGGQSELIIGNHTVVREYATISRGTELDGGFTRIGSHNFIMAYVHIAHDCQLGNHIILSNGVTFAGHCIVGDYVIIGGLSAIHQFCRIGAHAFLGGTSGVSQDIPPFVLATGNHTRLYGLNKEGLKRRGFSQEALNSLNQAYRIIFRTTGLSLAKAMERVTNEVEMTPEVQEMLDFIKASERGVCRKR